LILVISIKYLLYVMRADHHGEGGILALMALACPARADSQRGPLVLVALGLFGAALLYGDGMITPAISVLGAVEGLEIAAPSLAEYVVPITIAILIGLFLVQRHGTARVGATFGPIIMIWFLVLATLGIRQIAAHPGVVWALSPTHAVEFFVVNRAHGVVVLGAVFLVVTGGEALYADMGHFGARPIRITWFTVVLPALMINYLGQGALLLAHPEAAANPFYNMAPTWALYPLLGLAAMATVIASQAVISGAFSLSRQAVMLGYLPRLRIVHTSSKEVGQIYIPVVNWFLMFATIGLVLGFRSSSRLAAAYGIAVTTTMVITTVLAYRVAHRDWKWGALAVAATAVFLVIDLLFFGANAVKFVDGGWFPLAVAAGVFVLMTTWKRGRAILADRYVEKAIPWNELVELVADAHRVPGTAVYMTSSFEGAPPALVQNTRHNHVVHERVVLLTIETLEMPRVAEAERLRVERLDNGFVRLAGRYGFSESPSVPELLRVAAAQGVDVEMDKTTFFLGRETLLATLRPGMALWRERLFATMSRNAHRATAYFDIPPDRVMEVGSQIEL
jgi:KUP system potassium uptake protein